MTAWRVTGLFCLIAVEAILYGYSYPFFTLALEKRELAFWLIGFNASLAGLGILFVGPFLPYLIARFGMRILVAGLFAISLASFGVLLATDNLVVWFAVRFVMGACFASLWTVTEIWLNGVVDDRHRGRIVGAAGCLYATFQILGPLTIGPFGVEGSLPLIVAMVPLAIGILVAMTLPSAAGETDKGLARERDFRKTLTLAGGIVAAAFFGGLGDTTMQSLLPIYGIAHGLENARAARLVAVFVLGKAVLIAGTGWMADRYGRRLVLNACVAVASLSTLAIPFFADVIPALWPILFLAGGTIAGIYTLGIVLIGQDFRGKTLAIVSTGFVMAYSAGSIVGPTLIGVLIDAFGTEAMPIAIAVGLVGLSTYLFVDDSDGTREPITEAPHAVMPNLKYLEDSQFDEDETTERTDTRDAVPDETPPSDTSPFRPTQPAPQTPRTSPPRTLPARAEPSLPEDDLQERFKRRSAEIAEIVAQRHKSREAHRSRPSPEPAKPPALPQRPQPSPNPFAPPQSGKDR